MNEKEHSFSGGEKSPEKSEKRPEFENGTRVKMRTGVVFVNEQGTTKVIDSTWNQPVKVVSSGYDSDEREYRYSLRSGEWVNFSVRESELERA